MTVDPGDNTAVCRWRNGKMIMADLKTYYHMIPSFSNIPVFSGTRVIIENVELWGGSEISYASAAGGDLFKLAFVVGCLIHDFRSQGCFVYIVSPKTWKGQLNYEKLRFILREKFHIDTKNDHTASAIGLCLWAKGVF